MIGNFNTVEELNLYYAIALTKLSGCSKNLNDNVLQCMVDELMRDYNLNLELLNIDISFAKKLYKDEKSIEQKQLLLNCSYGQRQKEFDYKQNKKKYQKLLRCYQKQRKVLDKKQLEIEKQSLIKKLWQQFEQSAKTVPVTLELPPVSDEVK